MDVLLLLLAFVKIAILKFKRVSKDSKQVQNQLGCFKVKY